MIVREDLENGLVRVYSDKGVKIRGGNPQGNYDITYIPSSATDRQYVETDIPVDKGSGPAQYSKVKILLAAKEDGTSQQLMSFIESNKEIEFIWHDSNVIEDNALLTSYMPLICSAMNKTEDEIRAFLNDRCRIA